MLDRRRAHEVHSERRLAEARAGGDDDQLAGVQAIGQLVELAPGDSATYVCSAPHWWANGADVPTVVLGAVSPFER